MEKQQLSLFDNEPRIKPREKENDPIRLSRKWQEFLIKKNVVVDAKLKSEYIVGKGWRNTIECYIEGRKTEFISKRVFIKFLNKN
jgi:hypothetical protein